MIDTDVHSAMSKMDLMSDVLTVKRVFGDTYEVDGALIIPVAAVAGAGGGGAGSGTDTARDETGTGSGIGLGMRARPVGVYVVRNGDVEWRPALDTTRVVLGAQLVALAAVFALRSILRHRRRTR